MILTAAVTRQHTLAASPYRGPTVAQDSILLSLGLASIMLALVGVMSIVTLYAVGDLLYLIR